MTIVRVSNGQKNNSSWLDSYSSLDELGLTGEPTSSHFITNPLHPITHPTDPPNSHHRTSIYYGFCILGFFATF